eukprot:gene30909-41134_t
MNVFSLFIYGSLFIFHCNVISGEYNISTTDDSSASTAAAAQDVITAYALADSYERNNSDYDSIIGEEGKESPSLSSVKLASKWMHSIHDADAPEPIHEGDYDEPSDDLDREETGIEENVDTGRDYNSSNSTETNSQQLRESALDDTVYDTSDSILADNVTVLELLKEQIARDFAPFIIIINAITPAPVKAFLAAQFAVLSTKLQLVFRGAFSPLLSAAAKAFRFTGNGFIFISQELVKWQEASETGGKPATSSVPDNADIAVNPEAAAEDSPVDTDRSSTSTSSSDPVEEENAETVSDTLTSDELEILEEGDERSEEFNEEGEEEEEDRDYIEA